MNSVDVASCSHSQGWPIVRVRMLAVTDSEKPKQSTPHSTISASSRRSSARHFRWRCRCSTSLSAIAINLPVAAAAASHRLVDRSDQVLDLLGVGPEIACELVEIGIGDLLEAGLVDVGDDLDADLLKPGRCGMLQCEAALRLLRADVTRRGRDPLLLLGRKAMPELVADPENRVVGLVLAHRQHGGDFVVLVDEIDVDGVLA